MNQNIQQQHQQQQGLGTHPTVTSSTITNAATTAGDMADNNDHDADAADDDNHSEQKVDGRESNMLSSIGSSSCPSVVSWLFA